MTFLKENCSGLESGPEVIPAKGLSPDRQWYLYDQIRQFCPESTKDLVCPLPSVPQNQHTNIPGQFTRTEVESQAKRWKTM